MKTRQRIILAAYSALVLFCCTWIPWYEQEQSASWGRECIGYGWLWSGPITTNPGKNIIYESIAQPDIPLIVLHVAAVSAFAAVVFLLAPLVTRKRAGDVTTAQGAAAGAPR